MLRELVTRSAGAAIGIVGRPVAAARSAARTAGAIADLPDTLDELEDLRDRTARAESELAQTRRRVQELSERPAAVQPVEPTQRLGSMFASTVPPEQAVSEEPGGSSGQAG
jgi:hypothetical protein